MPLSFLLMIIWLSSLVLRWKEFILSISYLLDSLVDYWFDCCISPIIAALGGMVYSSNTLSILPINLPTPLPILVLVPLNLNFQRNCPLKFVEVIPVNYFVVLLKMLIFSLLAGTKIPQPSLSLSLSWVLFLFPSPPPPPPPFSFFFPSFFFFFFFFPPPP